jgi:uncharacterized protein YjcR
MLKELKLTNQMEKDSHLTLYEHPCGAFSFGENNILLWGWGEHVMSRSRSPDRDKAVKLWLKSGRQMKPAEIAEKIGVSASMVRKWKSMDEWDKLPEPKPGAPRGNRNAKGNKGGSAPLMNENAVKHGLFRKFLPDDDETREIYDMTADISLLDLLWEGIRIKWTNFLRAQKIQFVRDNKDITKVLKKKKPGMFGTEQEWEYQQPWDKNDTALSSQSAAWSTIVRMIKQYEEMLRAMPPEDVQEEHRLRVEKLKVEVSKAKGDQLPDPVIFEGGVNE